MSLNKLPEVITKTTLHEENFFKLSKERLKIPEQEDYDYFLLESFPYSVMVIATTELGEYVLNWEYRHPTRQILLSSPGGIMDVDETPLECAKRELMEETGYEAERFEIIGESYPFPGISSQKTIFVRAYNARPFSAKKLDHAELIETELFTWERITNFLKEKKPVDGLLISALFFTQNRT